MHCTFAQLFFLLFFFNDPATTEIYTLSLHDALPISPGRPVVHHPARHERPMAGDPARCAGRRRLRRTAGATAGARLGATVRADRKSTRLNSSHGYISYAVFCLKKKKKKHQTNVMCQI